MSNLTNLGQRYESEKAWRGSTEFDGTTFYIGLTNATLTKSSLLAAAEASETLGRITAPGALTAALAGSGAGNLGNGAYKYKVAFTNGVGETEAGTVSATVTVADNSTNGQIALSAIPLGINGDTTGRKLYRTVAGGSTYKLLATLADNSTTTYNDNIADGSLGADAPSTNTTAGGNGYARQELPQDATGIISSALSSGDWELTTKAFSFAAAAGVIGPFKAVFLSDAQNPGDPGNLFAWWDLTATRTLLPGESWSWAGKMKKR